MRFSVRLVLLLFVALPVLAASAPQPHTEQPFPDFGFLPPPSSYTGPAFKLSQDYPTTLDSHMPPFMNMDFHDMQNYMAAVRHYCIEGNPEVDWVVQNNKIRKWYHMPWQHYGTTGREGVRGLTKEAPVQQYQLAATQAFKGGQTYAVGFYNPRGAYAIGHVWKHHFHPDPQWLNDHGFPEGTVVSKLLFVTNPINEIPSLAVNPIQWNAYVATSFTSSDRVFQKVTLIQMDIAVRDHRAPLGWIFGTFQYNGALNNKNPWDNLTPVGLMFGNDPENNADTYTNPTPNVTKINPDIKESIINATSDLPSTHLGWNGRLNGPVDNPRSSCMSCHMTAESPQLSQMSPLFNSTPPGVPAVGSAEWMRWFQNIKCQHAFDTGALSTDFSLQMAIALQNFRSWDKTQDGIFASDYTPAPSTKGHKLKAMRLDIQGSREAGAGNEVPIIRDKPEAQENQPPAPKPPL